MSRPAQGGLTAAALILIPLLAVAGSDSLRAALDFTTGVLSLVSLTAAVAWGLLATDRLLLRPRHRLLAQGVHRATAVASLGFLLLHVTVKVSLGHVALLGALVPFGLGVSGTSGLIGFGSLAGFLMVVAASTGALRSAFATPGRTAGRWRSLHMVAYPAWGSALVHGLFAGRPAAGWVVTMYALCLAAVVAALSLRLLPPPLKRTITDRVVALATSGSLAPAPEPAPRDSATSPLPGGGFAPPQEPPRPQRRPEQLFRDDTQPPPHRLTAPAPPLYEAGRSSEGLRGAPDTGISAAYRAVSAATAASAPTERIPLAEQIPLTEEIPVQAPPPSPRWPTPSPPPPAQALRPPYDPDRAAYGPGAVPAPDLPGYGPDPVPNVPWNGQNPETNVPWNSQSYETDLPWNGQNAVPDLPAYAPDMPTGPLPHPHSLDNTEPAPGPPYRPAAGEPWHAPAGDRR
ncbi:hypothetical protein J7E96_10710 [Streptomyces sp. ISL-96]|uniref:hypothetical protein n=1 Tax=Streptomyces sp. ISL-96 TaxID=2819191 RepID=UPI001BEA6402|nr:hypothetical protein [Streptomyces sp. ISL-96]MBT2488988.1 hypothetical protein [Streptomyces sp. ISL-96]